MGIYDKRYHIRDIRWGWTDEEIEECERMVRQERIAQVYSNDRYGAKEDYSVLMAKLAPKIPPSLCGVVFVKKVLKRIQRRIQNGLDRS